MRFNSLIDYKKERFLHDDFGKTNEPLFNNLEVLNRTRLSSINKKDLHQDMDLQPLDSIFRSEIYIDSTGKIDE